MIRVIRGGICAALLLVLMQGCAAVQYVDDQVTGNLYLRENRHEEGIRDFQARVRENPEAHLPHYYLGRFLLAQDRPEEAEVSLRKAVQLDPENAEYRYWLGVAYWALDDPENERLAYEQALTLDPEHIPARVYLGHNLLDAGDARGALNQYNQVLVLAPGQPEALYSRAAALTILGEDLQAVEAWKDYLAYYPEGSLARDAAMNLNQVGNFSYRTQVIGVRQMVLKQVTFEPGTALLADDSLPSLDAVGAVMERNHRFNVAVNAFAGSDQGLAQARAQSVRSYILNRHPLILPDRIQVQAFDRPERIRVGDTTYALEESIVFHTVRQEEHNEALQ